MKYVCVLLSISVVSCSKRITRTKYGWVEGKVSDNGNFYSFMGIPYAQVEPENPFGEAMDAEPFLGVFEATDDSKICPQQDDLEETIVGTLDCLIINIYVPKEANGENLAPVMVFIHGGGFKQWNSNKNSYGPDFLVDHGVILVTFNYRLGPYGFMSINRSDIPGNAGLKDQLRALEWIKENIRAFYGDENNITLFGEDAGAASVEFHILSEHSNGLFHKAIMQSGTALCDWVMVEPDLRAPIKIADNMGFLTDDVNDAIHYLTKFDPKDVIAATLDVGYGERFRPTVEHEFENVRAMIKNKPSNLLNQVSFSLNAKSISIPIIIGFNSREERRLMRHCLFSPRNYFITENKTFKTKILQYFNFNQEELDEVVRLVTFFYIGNQVIGSNCVNEMLQFNSDFSFIYPILRDIRYYLQAGTSSIFLYIFDYAGQRNYMRKRFNLPLEVGAVHGDEIGYLFNQSNIPYLNLDRDTEMIKTMTKMWTDFAKTGKPTNTTKLSPFRWQSVTREPLKFAVLSDDCHMTYHPYRERMGFWDRFFESYGEKAKW